MGTRITIDLKNPSILKQLKAVAAEKQQSIRELVVEAIEAYFSDHLENRAITKLAESVFEEWDNAKDKDYDKL